MRYLGLILLLFCSLTGFAQERNDLAFIRHLIDQRMYREAIFLIGQDTTNGAESQCDSLNFFAGWAHYSLKNLEASTESFLKVGENSPFYRKSHFFAGYNQVYLKNYPEAKAIFRQMNLREEPELSLLNFELGGLEMLQQNWEQAAAKLNTVNPDNPSISQQLGALEQMLREYQARRPKSAVLAGIMSGILPGSGKIYAGKTGSGIASMIGTIGFGLIAWENYDKRGIGNAKTLIFGSLFLANYVSNIYGSVISVKVSENEYRNAMHNQILFQLHIPLRNFFD